MSIFGERSRDRLPKGYSLGVLVGSGKTGNVWRAREDATNRRVAVKIAVGSKGARLQMEREASVLRSADVDCLPRLYSLESGPRRSWMVMEYIHGVSVKQLVSRGLSRQESDWLAGAVVSSVAALHRAGRLHGDLDPEHLILESSGAVRIVDLGASAALTGSVIGGSSGYMAPEAPNPGADPSKAESWSVGVVLHEILCGHRPGPSGPDRDALWKSERWFRGVEACLSGVPDQRPDLEVLQIMAAGSTSPPEGFLARVGVEADLELARRLREASARSLAGHRTRDAWELLAESVELDPDDAESVKRLGEIRISGDAWWKSPWSIVGGAVVLAALVAGAVLWLSDDPPPASPAGSHRKERLREGAQPVPRLPLRDGGGDSR